MIEKLREVREVLVTYYNATENDRFREEDIVPAIAKVDALITEVEKAEPVGHFMRHGEKYVQCVGEASYTVPLYTAPKP